MHFSTKCFGIGESGARHGGSVSDVRPLWCVLLRVVYDPTLGGFSDMPDRVDGKRFRTRYAAYRTACEDRRDKYIPLYRAQAEAYLGAEGLTPMERLHLFHLLALASRNGDVKVSVSELAVGLHTSERTVQLSLRHLEELGWIHRIQYHPNEPSVFFLVPPDEVLAPGPATINLDQQ